MKITDLMSEEGIDLNGKPGSKDQVIVELTELMGKTGNLTDVAEYRKSIEAREDQGTTAIGEGIAIPHGRSNAVKKPALAAMVVPAGTDYDSLDGAPTKLFFEIAVPEDSNNAHLELLSRLSMMLMDEKFRDELLAATDKQQFMAIVDKKEAEKFPEEGGLDAVERAVAKLNEKEAGLREAAAETDLPRLLAVTACPTGIAHTYMAAEGLQQAADKLGVTIKVETNGSGGAKNVVTPAEIAAADAIIIAADKKVDIDRFAGKPVLQVPVKDGIHRPEELINDALSGKAPVLAGDASAAVVSTEKESVGRKIYKDLMNGVSNMLPFVIGGGILIAIAFLLDDYSIDPSNFGMNTPVAAFFKTIGGYAFGFMLPVLSAYIAKSIADRPAFMPGFLGGYLASVGTVWSDGAFANVGVSGFLGALVAGFAIGYMMLGIEKLCDKMPDSLQGIKPTLIYPVFGLLLTGLGMVFIINPPVSMLNQALTNGLNAMGGSSKIILGFVLGGMMAIDMGGPFNKAAYVFGTGMLAEGQYDIMAAVMIGGMVPPIGIALASTFFPNRFTKSERSAGITNYIMGLCFITEGAIPFAAADPARVIPSCVLGSGVAGALSMAFGATLMAPHGGIFVFPVVGNPLMYVVALVIGSLITMAMLAILKKPIKDAA
jgi:PTS system fructose-specific IIC component